MVKVPAPAVDGKANLEVIKALAEALGVKRSDITLVVGNSGRTKIFEIRGTEPAGLADLFQK
jgi:uncharacterized protein (TIGR00251 family)